MAKHSDEIKEFHDSFVKQKVVEQIVNDDFISQHHDLIEDENIQVLFWIQYCFGEIFQFIFKVIWYTYWEREQFK